MARKRSLSDNVASVTLEEPSASPPSGGMLSYLNPFSYMRAPEHDKNSDEADTN